MCNVDIKLRGTSKAGILVFNLDDSVAAADMKLATQAPYVKIALDDFMVCLRQIRKYDVIPETTMPISKKLEAAIKLSDEYYKTLFIKCLNDCDVANILD